MSSKRCALRDAGSPRRWSAWTSKGRPRRSPPRDGRHERRQRRARQAARGPPSHRRDMVPGGCGVNPLICCPQCSMGVILRPLQWRWSNNAGDELLECLTCGYATVYGVRTGQCEPRPGQPRDEWQPPVGWPRPRRVDATAESSLTHIVEAVPASPSQHDPAQPGAELATDAGAATPLETPRNQELSEDPENRQASDGSEGIAQQTRGGAPGNASSDLAAETPHQLLRPTGSVEAGNNSRSTARPGGDDRRPESVDGVRRPNGTGDARDPVR